MNTELIQNIFITLSLLANLVTVILVKRNTDHIGAVLDIVEDMTKQSIKQRRREEEE